MPLIQWRIQNLGPITTLSSSSVVVAGASLIKAAAADLICGPSRLSIIYDEHESTVALTCSSTLTATAEVIASEYKFIRFLLPQWRGGEYVAWGKVIGYFSDTKLTYYGMDTGSIVSQFDIGDIPWSSDRIRTPNTQLARDMAELGDTEPSPEEPTFVFMPVHAGTSLIPGRIRVPNSPLAKAMAEPVVEETISPTVVLLPSRSDVSVAGNRIRVPSVAMARAMAAPVVEETISPTVVLLPSHVGPASRNLSSMEARAKRNLAMLNSL